VDRAHLDTAREYLRRLAEDAGGDDSPGPDAPTQDDGADRPTRTGDVAGRDVDEAWAQIVAGFDADAAAPRRPWPASEDLSDEARRPRRLRARPPRTAQRSTTDDDEPSLLDGLDTFGADLPDAEEEGYDPPAAPPVPRPSLPAVLGVVGIIGGIVLFLRPDLLPVGEGTAMVLGFAACLAGAITLVWRLRSGDEDDDYPDDGARV
jgi:hypothetical protein